MQNKKLKILVLTDDFEPIYGGITSVVKNSTLALSKFADITIGTVIPPDNLKDKINDLPQYKVFRCDGKYNKITTNMTANLKDENFKANIEAEKYDIIHCHFPLKLYKYALQLRKKYDIPVVITAHSIFYTDFKAVIKSDLLTKIAIRYILGQYNKSNKTFCVSQFEQKFLQKFGLKNSVLLNNGVIMDSFTPIDEAFVKELKQKYQIKENDFVLSSISRLAPMKNIPFSIHAFAELHKKYPNTKFLIVGDGEQYKLLSELISELNLEDSCFLIGGLSDKSKLGAIYTLSDAISFMSKGDSCGLIQYEASYFSTPTIALSNTAVGDCLTDMENGIVITGKQNGVNLSKKLDTLAISNYVEKVGALVENRNLCKQLGKNAKEQLYTTYDDNYAKKLIQIYLEIIKDYKK